MIRGTFHQKPPLKLLSLLSTPSRWQCYLFTFSLVLFFCIDTETSDIISTLVPSIREYVVDLEEGSQHLMRYRTIAPLVSSGAVQLM